jgi:ribonuclease PH
VKQAMIRRHDGRSAEQLRPVKLSYDIFGYSDSSVLLELGNTKVLCAITLVPGVPPFLRGKGTGWLTAEYAMLPTATQKRAQRESSMSGRNGRSVEISRFIGRALRAAVDLTQIPDHTIMIDCDVLQADGSTRTACITGAFFALLRAHEKWLEKQKIQACLIQEEIAAVSVGIKDGVLLLDLDYTEDIDIDADYNFVLTKSGAVIEIQGSAEKKPIAWDRLHQAREIAMHAVNQLLDTAQKEKISMRTVYNIKDNSRALV